MPIAGRFRMMAIDYASTSIGESETATLGIVVRLHSVATKAPCYWHTRLSAAVLTETERNTGK